MLRKIFPYTKGVLKFFIIILVLSIITSQIGVLSPQLLRIFIDDIVIGRNLSRLVIVIGGYVCIYLILLVISGVTLYATNRFFNRLLFNISHAVWKNYLYMQTQDMKKKDPII